MQELEKILEEMEKLRGQVGSKCTSEDHYIKRAWEHCLDRVEYIIHTHMNDNKCGDCSRRKWYQKGYKDGKKNNDGWIPVERKLPPNARLEGAFCPKYQVMTKYGVTEGWYNPNAKGWYVLIWFMTDRYLDNEIDFDRGDKPKIVFLPDEVNSKCHILIAWKGRESYSTERSDNHDGD